MKRTHTAELIILEARRVPIPLTITDLT